MTERHLPVEHALMLQTQNTKADCCIMWFDKTIAWQRRALVILEVILSGGVYK